MSAASVASAIGTISSGSATFSLLASPGGQRLTDFRPLGIATGNQINEDFWAFNPFFSGTSLFSITSESYVGNTATIGIDTGGNSPGTLTYQLTTTPTAVTLTSTLTIMLGSTSVGAAKLYHYTDIDAGGITNNSAVLLSANRMRATGGTGTVDYSAIASSDYQGGLAAAVRNTVLASPSQTLTNTGLPFASGNFTGAYEWDFPMTQGVPVTHTISYVVAIPEPATLAGLATVGIIVLRRRPSAH